MNINAAHDKAYRKAYRHRPEVKDRDRAYQKAYLQRPEIIERMKINARAYHQRPEVKERRLQRTYGLTTEAFESMLIGQGSACAICNSSDWGPKGPVIDHDHESGVIRGIICHRCNIGIGMFDDNPKLLQNATMYLEKK